MKTGTKVIQRVFALLVTLCMMCAVPMAALAADVNSAVNDAKNGVVQILITYTDDNQVDHNLTSGTGFLINNSTVITCDHVVSLSENYVNFFANVFGKSVSDFKGRLNIKISVLRDVTIKATVKNQSSEMDYAILNLESQLYDRTYLPIRSSSEVQATETVYALGFPGEVADVQDVNIYTPEDVNVTSGKVGKNDRFTFAAREWDFEQNAYGIGRVYQDVDCISHNALLQAGISGGPLLDSDGYVIGINAAGDETNNFSVSIDQLTKTLDALGIEYTTSGSTSNPALPPATDPEPVPTNAPEETPAATPIDKVELTAAITDAQLRDLEGYDEQSVEAFTDALTSAQDVLSNDNATQQEVDAATAALTDAAMNLKETAGFPIWIIIALVAVVAVIVIVLIVVIVKKNGNKSRSGQNTTPEYNSYPPVSGGYQAPSGGSGGFSAPPTKPQPDYVPVGGTSTVTTVLSAGSGDTTVLNAGSTETTVLNQDVNYGTLVRVKSGERIKINSASFVIGKEMAKVNYCVSDNTSVSRTHVRITNRAGVTYVVDLKTTNGTFINGVKLAPNQETPLHNGDKLSLADEEFTFSI